MHRFHTENEPCREDATVPLSAEESKHALKVLRLREGEEIRLLDGTSLWKAELVIEGGEAFAHILEEMPTPESPVQVTLLQGLPKADKLEWIIQKCTELGVYTVLPADMSRSIVHADRFRNPERMQRTAMEAAKQSGRAHVPEISVPVSFKKALEACDDQDLILVAWEEEHTLLESECVRAYVQENGKPHRVMIVIGPEGGIDPSEWEKLKEKGARAVSLGPRILRTETAGLCAMSVLWAALGEM